MSESAANTVYVVTGANRGIGLGLTKALLARPATTIIATAREPAITILNTELASSPTGAGSIYHVFELDAGSLPSPAIIRERFLDETKLSSVDILIANAGMATSLGAALDVTAADLQTHFAVNATAPLMNFQALWPLMRETKAPKLFSISSSVGCIEMSELPGGAYGPSKAALNWITKRLHCEGANDGLVSVAVHPGWVQTANGMAAAKAWGYDGQPPLTVDESVNGVLSVIDGATRDTTSGKFVSYDGQILPW